MSDESTAAGPPEPFDLGKLRELVELMEKHGLTEVNLRRGDQRWRLRRGPQEIVSMVPAQPAYSLPPSATNPAAPPAPADVPAAAVGLLIKSPTVGTFYAAASPDDPPFVSIGARVDPETTVCIVEAMKVFNQIPAEVSGTIVEVLVKNGDPVEFGQPLFRVRPD
ncbi:MAG TPA: acetyl-CoA carboxylase biotin carboxyl carrier protein [Planctomycetaceae bacterium]|nr:acetyl-CoA carboxylase biotin carboxyl carrier protein [Planctomycetaceae bacterium]